MVSALLAHLAVVPAPLAYGLIAALVFAEAALFVGFVIPGESAALLGGALAASGHLSLLLVLGLVVAAGVIGDSVGFEVGRRVGPRLLDLRLLRRQRPRLESAQLYLRSRGGRAVVLGRFTAFLRAVMPALAGASTMPYRRFVVFNALGGVLWGAAVTLGGFFAGQSFELVQRYLGGASALLLGGLVLLLVWHAWRRRQERTAASSAYPRTYSGQPPSPSTPSRTDSQPEPCRAR